MKKRYRISTDAYLGYEVQWRPKWWPFWQSDLSTFRTLEDAENHAKSLVKRVVKDLGEM